MKKAVAPVLVSLLLLGCTTVVQASEKPGAAWSAAYEAFILEEDYLSWTSPEFYKETPEAICFGLYDLDGDGFPELVAYNGCPYMAGACNYIFTCRDGQVTYVGDAGFRGSVLQYYPTGDYGGLFCSDGNNGIIVTAYYEMVDGGITDQMILEQDYNAVSEDGVPAIKQITDDTDLFLTPQTENPVTLQMFTVSEIRSLGWKGLISRYPFVAESGSAGNASPSAEETDPAGTPTGNAASQAPFYGIWCSASKNSADLQSVSGLLSQYGLPSEIFVTTDWDNLNPEFWYVLSAGTYASETEAKAALSRVQSVVPDAYVKYSGAYIGG